jgi:hypothetical protein
VTHAPRPRLHAGLLALAALALFAPAAFAIWVPQTRAEFVDAVAKGTRGAKMESFVIERGFDDVVKTFDARCVPCLDKLVERTANVGYVERSSSDYNPSFKHVSRDRAEFTMQVVHRPAGVGATPPAGGLYVMAVDLKRAGANRTEVVLYRPTMGYKFLSEALLEWAEGKSTDCPKLK